MSAAPAFTPHSHLPYGADGAGFYTDNTLGCFDVMANAQPLVLKALDSSPVEPAGAYTLCDYGTADGGTSLFLLGACVKAIKEKYGEGKEVMVYYEDQPSNDFQSLFKRIHGLLPCPPSFVTQYPGVYAACVGTSFFSPCFPASSIHLGVSFTAMHWLSDRPCTLTGTIHHTQAQKEEERTKFHDQAARDWNTILMARVHELAPGGQMVIVSLSKDEEGQYLGNTKRVKHSMFERMTSHWASMVADGTITQEEFDDTTVNNYYRTTEEISAPFSDPESPVSKAGLRLVSVEHKLVPCHYREKWMASSNKDDPEAAAAHARWYVPTTRTWSNSVFRSALSPSRSDDDKAKVVDELFKRYEGEVATAPNDHGMDYIHAYIHIRKEL